MQETVTEGVSGQRDWYQDWQDPSYGHGCLAAKARRRRPAAVEGIRIARQVGACDGTCGQSRHVRQQLSQSPDRPGRVGRLWSTRLGGKHVAVRSATAVRIEFRRLTQLTGRSAREGARRHRRLTTGYRQQTTAPAVAWPLRARTVVTPNRRNDHASSSGRVRTCFVAHPSSG